MSTYILIDRDNFAEDCFMNLNGVQEWIKNCINAGLSKYLDRSKRDELINLISNDGDLDQFMESNKEDLKILEESTGLELDEYIDHIFEYEYATGHHDHNWDISIVELEMDEEQAIKEYHGFLEDDDNDIDVYLNMIKKKYSEYDYITILTWGN